MVDVEDRPGVLADLTRRIAKAGVDLDLVYVATRNRVVFGAPDLDGLKAALDGSLSGFGPYSGQLASPVVAPRITFSDSSAHLRRVGEMSMPSCSITQSAPRLRDLLDRHPDQLLRGDRRGRLRDRAALAVEAEVLDAAVLDDDVHAQLVAAERVVVVPLEVVRLELAEVPRVLVVLEDVVAVQSVHRYSSNTSRALPSASTSRSTSSREL